MNDHEPEHEPAPGTPEGYCCACAHSALFALVEKIAQAIVPESVEP